QKYSIKVVVEAGGSGAGIKNTINGISDIGMVSRELYPEEIKKLKFTTIAIDGLAIIVNIENPINEITRDQLIEIYTGKVLNWNEYCNYNKEIIVVTKEIGRSTLELFEHYSGLLHFKRNNDGKNGKIIPSAFEIGSNLEMATIVGGIPNAIGYVSIGTAQKLIKEGMPIKILTIDKIVPTVENIISGKYPIIRTLNLVYIKENQDIKNFINFIFTEESKKIIEEEGFIAYK
ncbi:MAG: phosphate ABC transporter substrate-binding protein, partial [Exilispira sp.]